MKVAIVHYHLRRGGVTRVMENAVLALQELGVETVAVVGEAAEAPFPGPVEVVPALNYREEPAPEGGLRLAESLRAAARNTLGGPPDLWHVHNPTLGKNIDMTGAVASLVQNGARMLCQIHDFAEDGRPHNYNVVRKGLQSSSEHPAYLEIPTVHYAVLNGRDRDLLQQAGFPEERLHLLANPVPPPPDEEEDPRVRELLRGRRLWLYPTRAIRRKNLGELLLWSLLGTEEDLFATSLTPANPQQRGAFDRFAPWAKEKNLPVRFGLGDVDDLPFVPLMYAAHAHLTCSVAEGFGLAFLEPWTFGKALAGRNLPEITQDFAGVDLSALYDRLLVPQAWIETETLRERLGAKLAETYATYGVDEPPNALERAWAGMTEGEQIDFGRLDETAQIEVLEHLVTHPEDRPDIHPPSLEPLASEDAVSNNRIRVMADFSLSAYGEKLLSLYKGVLESESDELTPLPAERLLHSFLDPARFNLLRT